MDTRVSIWTTRSDPRFKRPLALFKAVIWGLTGISLGKRSIPSKTTGIYSAITILFQDGWNWLITSTALRETWTCSRWAYRMVVLMLECPRISLTS